MAFNLTLVKKHPIASTGIVLVGGLAAWYIFNGSSDKSSAAPQPSGAMVVYGNQGSTGDSGQSAAQAQQIQGQLAALGIQSQTQIALAQLSNQGHLDQAAYQYQIAQLSAAADMAHDQLAADVSNNQVNAQLQAIMAQYQSAVQTTALNADVVKYTTQVNASLQSQIADYQAGVSVYNALANQNIAGEGATALPQS